MTVDRDDPSRFVALVRRYSVDAVAFQGLAASMRVWFDEGGGAVAYFDTGRAWVAAGGPVCPEGERRVVASRFVEAARRLDRRASFFGVEHIGGFGDWQKIKLGEQPTMSPAEWMRSLHSPRARGLREQLRRARKKGVTATVRPSCDLREASLLRRDVDALLARWVASRRMETMGFLVAPDPFTLPDEHVYVVAMIGDSVVGLLSAVPAYADVGFLVEHLVCAPGSPNGTAETLLDALHQALLEVSRGADRISLGLAPLAGAATWQIVARNVTRPLFDFDGLRRFKARLHPSEWRPVWLVTPAGESPLAAVADSLTAFAGGGLVRFGLRSLFLHPRGFLCVLALGLVPWTALLLGLDLANAEGAAGYSRPALALWVAFDALLAAGLFRAALRPAYVILVTLFVAALSDATVSSIHLHTVGLGPTLPDSLLRIAAAVAPAAGATAILIITLQRASELSGSRARTISRRR